MRNDTFVDSNIKLYIIDVTNANSYDSTNAKANIQQVLKMTQALFNRWPRIDGDKVAYIIE